MAIRKIISRSITDGAVVATDVAALSIDSTKLASNAVTNAKIASNAISSDKLDTNIQFAFKNRIINGDMRIDQRNAGAAVTNANGYIVDRLLSNSFGGATGRWTAQQVTDAPSGFTNSFRATVTTTDAAPSSSFAYRIAAQLIEGNNVADLSWGTASAKTITISFWVKSSVTGSFPCVIHNGAVTRGYGALYTISSANTWEYKTLTISGDTTGVWSTDNSSGIIVAFGAGGSTRTISAGVWSAVGGTTPTTVTGAVNLLATSGATWQITGLQLEVGSSATPFDYRPYGTELALCQRYYQQLTGASNIRVAIGGSYNSTSFNNLIKLVCTMRTAPTFAAPNLGQILLEAVAWYNVTSISGYAATPDYVTYYPVLASSSFGTNAIAWHGTSDQTTVPLKLTFSSEL